MTSNTKIGWTDHTFSPWWGCARISPGCARCYADSLASRYGNELWRRHGDRRIVSEATWRNPLGWNRDAETAGRQALVFCASMADVFEGRTDLDEPRERLWKLIARTPWLRWQLLTKRPENVAAMVPWGDDWPSNVLIGASVEDQRRADERIPHLVKLPAMRFLSVEPLLGPVNLDLDGISWVVVGGESGPKARPCGTDWIRAVRDQCAETETRLFVKQLGTGWAKANRLRGKGQTAGQDPSVWPFDLRIQQPPPELTVGDAKEKADA